jgi:hypothetical protein
MDDKIEVSGRVFAALLHVVRRLVAAADHDARNPGGGAISWFDAECSEIARDARKALAVADDDGDAKGRPSYDQYGNFHAG